jgi:hypothetical protein
MCSAHSCAICEARCRSELSTCERAMYANADPIATAAIATTTMAMMSSTSVKPLIAP